MRNAALVLGESMSLVVSPDRETGHRLEKNLVAAETDSLPPGKIQRPINANWALYAKYPRLI